MLAATGGRYHEPFLGSGAMFFAVRPARAALSDVNAGLINAFVHVRDDPDGLVAAVRAPPTGKEAYYDLRARHDLAGRAAAARFLYLNRLAYGGLYRENKQGLFNVPYGGRPPDALWQRNLLRDASSALAGADIECRCFTEAFADVRRGDVVYCDPVYYKGPSRRPFRYGATVPSRPTTRNGSAASQDKRPPAARW